MPATTLVTRYSFLLFACNQSRVRSAYLHLIAYSLDLQILLSGMREDGQAKRRHAIVPCARESTCRGLPALPGRVGPCAPSTLYSRLQGRVGLYLRLLIIGDYFRGWPAHLQLRADFLQPSRQAVDLVFLLCQSRLQVLHFLVLFQKFIEDHRVHLVVANAVRFSFLVARHEIRAYLFHLLGNEPKGERARRFYIRLVAKADGLEVVDYFAGLLHPFDLILEAL